MEEQTVTNNAQVMVTFDLGEVHETSVDLLRSLEEAGVSLPVGAAALAMSLGRVLSPKVMEQEEEVKFIQTALEWMGMYFVEGEVN